MALGEYGEAQNNNHHDPGHFFLKQIKKIMKAFGIEIRKANSIGGLYDDVDRILASSGLCKSEPISKDIQRSTVAHALQKMMQADSHFSVCTIDRCRDVCQVVIPIERYRIYSAVHCINWNQMEPNYQTQIIAMILDDFREILNPQ